MDQAISMLAQKGTGKLIRFKPLSAETVSLPQGFVSSFVCLMLIAICSMTFVVAHSLVASNKYVTASTNYNMRYNLFVMLYVLNTAYSVAECRFASLLLGKYLHLKDFLTLITLRDVQVVY